MKAFHLGNDRKRVYFQNLERVPLEVEFQNVITELKKHGCTVGEMKEVATADIYLCNIGPFEFDLCYDEMDDGTSLYVENSDALKELRRIFDFID